METKFISHGKVEVNRYGCLEIQISDDKTKARIKLNYKDEPQCVSRWQSIKSTTKGREYVIYWGKRYYMDMFSKK